MQYGGSVVKSVLLARILALCAVAVGLNVGAAYIVAGVPINYLPLGDSITAQGKYFTNLDSLLTTNGYTPTRIYNEGKSGYIIQGKGSPATADATRNGLLENISTYLNHPNVNASNTYILLMIGTNDADVGYKLGSSDVPSVQTRMGSLISSIESIAPLSHLIVAQIVPNLRSVAYDQRVQQFNLDVAASVATAQTVWPDHVSLVDMYTPFQASLYAPYTTTTSPYFPTPPPYDYLHPDQDGGDLMGTVWYDGIVAVPEPSTVAMLTAGVLGLLAVAWRRQRAA